VQRKVLAACGFCVARKMKCDMNRPCRTCILKGKEASSQDVPKKKTLAACRNCKTQKMKCDNGRPCRPCVERGKASTCRDDEIAVEQKDKATAKWGQSAQMTVPESFALVVRRKTRPAARENPWVDVGFQGLGESMGKAWGYHEFLVRQGGREKPEHPIRFPEVNVWNPREGAGSPWHFITSFAWCSLNATKRQVAAESSTIQENLQRAMAGDILIHASPQLKNPFLRTLRNIKFLGEHAQTSLQGQLAELERKPSVEDEAFLRHTSWQSSERCGHYKWGIHQNNGARNQLFTTGNDIFMGLAGTRPFP